MQGINDYSYSSILLNSINEKIEGKIRDLHFNRQFIIGINNIEDFVLSRLKITQFFFDLEDDLREFLQKYKNLFIHNKELSDKNTILSNQIRNIEIKSYNSENIYNDYKHDISDLLNQISILKEKQYSNEKYIKSLEEKLRLREINIGKRNDFYLENYTRKDYNDISGYHINYDYEKRNDFINRNQNINLGKQYYTPENNSQKDEFVQRNQVENQHTDNKKSYSNFVQGFLSSYKKTDNKVNQDNDSELNQVRNNYNEKNNENVINLKNANENNDSVYKFDDVYSNTALVESNQEVENNLNPRSRTIEQDENEKNTKKFQNIFSERENSKRMLNEYLKQSLNIPNENRNGKEKNKNYNKNERVEIEDHINNKIIKGNTNANFKSENVNKKGYEKENDNSKPNLDENDIREYAMNLPIRVKEPDENSKVSNFYENQSERNEKKIMNQNVQNSNRKKSDRIIDILTKIKSCEDTSKIIIKLYGDDIIDKIISPELDINILENIENTIIEIDDFKAKHKSVFNNDNQYTRNLPLKKDFNSYNEKQTNNGNKENYTKINNSNFTKNNEVNNYRRRNKSEYNLQDYSMDLPSTRLLNQDKNIDILNNPNNYSHYNLTGNTSNRGMRRSASKSSLNLTKNSHSRSKSKIDFFEDIPKDEMKFEQILRKYGGRKVSGKVFLNYFKQKGEFFDPRLQKGGVSSLDIKDQLRRSSSKKKLNNRSVNFSNN